VGFPTQVNGDIGNTTVTYKGYTLTSSTTYNFINHNLTNALDGLTSTAWSGNLGNYTTAGVPESTTRGGLGDYIQLELPNAIKLQHTKIFSQQTAGYSNGPRDITLYGSNNGTDWTSIKVATELPLNGHALNATVHVNSMTFYRYFRLEINKIWIDSGNATYPRIAEWELYGHEEGSGSLDTTLKSVYNVPATTGTQLEVYYDAKDLADGALSTASGAITGLGGTTINGTAFGDPQVSNGAFVFDGTGDYIETSTVLPSTFIDDVQHSIGMWFKVNTNDLEQTLMMIHNGGNYANQSPHIVISTAGILRYDFWTNDIKLLDPIVPNQWYHLMITFSGGNHASGTKFYINGVHNTNVSIPTSTATLDIQASSLVTVGARPNAAQAVRGSIANFRLYSKALNADQVKELYDYQKDYFLGSKSQVTLYKGHLGVGVTEPSGQLELAGDERIQEYPPRGLVGDETLYDPNGNAYEYNVEGHGVFKLLSSYRYHNGTGSNDRRIYKLFDKSNDTITHWSSFNSIAPYDAAGGSGAWVTTLDGGSTITAHIAEIQMPYKITLKKYILTSSSQVPRALKTGMIVGSNDGNVFHVLDSVSDFGFTATSQPKEYTVDNTTTPYRIFRLLLMNTNGHPTCNMNEWRLFGTPGPTTLDKGSLTLGRSLDVPRVSRYDVDTETPRPEKLLVDYDTTVNSSPTDISGKGNHGAFYGTNMNYSSADKAFVFNGTDDYIKLDTGLTGNAVHSVSMWIKAKADLATGYVDVLFYLGGGGSGNHRVEVVIEDDKINYNFSNNNYEVTFPVNTLVDDRWYHLVFTYNGVGGASGREVYIDGVQQIGAHTGASSAVLALADSNMYIAGNYAQSVGYFFSGQISNFKLYNVALEPSEVKKLYKLGRTGRSMVISDTAVGIGKVPEAQLDVRGVANVDGNLQINGFNAKRVLIGYQRYTNSTGVVYANSVTAEEYQNAWAVNYTRKRAGSQIYIISDLCVAQAIGATSGTNYRDIDARLKVWDGSTDRFSDVTRDWQRIDSSFFEYMRQNRIHFGPEPLPGGNTITVVAQVAQSAGSGTHTSWGINIWGGRSFIEIFETMEA
jgi:hypothetical protein